MRSLKSILSDRTSKLMLMGAALALVGTAVYAWEVPPPDDFLTGGGWILRANGAKANFGVGGGVKNGNWWGHLEYEDHGTGLNVHATSITAYEISDDNSRDICGWADTDQFGQVAFHLRAIDNGEPGDNDVFIIRLGQHGTVVYTTEGDPDHTLGGPEPGGGNIQLHKGNASNVAPNTPPDCEI